MKSLQKICIYLIRTVFWNGAIQNVESATFDCSASCVPCFWLIRRVSGVVQDLVTCIGANPKQETKERKTWIRCIDFPTIGCKKTMPSGWWVVGSSKPAVSGWWQRGDWHQTGKLALTDMQLQCCSQKHAERISPHLMYRLHVSPSKRGTPSYKCTEPVKQPGLQSRNSNYARAIGIIMIIQRVALLSR